MIKEINISMKSIRLIRAIIGFLCLGLGLSSCSKYLDVNTNPNSPTDTNITPELLFTNTCQQVASFQAAGTSGFLENWLGQWSASPTFAVVTDETTYNISSTFATGMWSNAYYYLYNLYLVNQKATAKDEPVLAAAATILSAKLWQDLVDVYNNVPYSNAFGATQNPTPTYDKGQDIYNNLQVKLDSAIAQLKPFEGSTPLYFQNVDYVCGGDLIKWVKFANTLKLRLLIHEANTLSSAPTTEIAKIQSNGGVLGSGETVSFNPGYSNQDGKQSPFYGNYGFSQAGNVNNSITCANDYFVTMLVANSDTDRLKRFFSFPDRNTTSLNPKGAAATTIVGTKYGISNQDATLSVSTVLGPGLANSATQNQWILTSVESAFLTSEAVTRGWMTGNAKENFQAAVKESFTWLGADTSHLATYFANAPIANWDSVATKSLQTQIKFVLFQKYIALCGTDPWELWADHRRLNPMPDNGYISQNPGKISNVLPVRLLYPQSEYTSNATNVNAEGTINQFSSKIFWMP